jgi:hypothetical protein
VSVRSGASTIARAAGDTSPLEVLAAWEMDADGGGRDDPPQAAINRKTAGVLLFIRPPAA